jgi:hypothetical protein
MPTCIFGVGPLGLMGPVRGHSSQPPGPGLLQSKGLVVVPELSLVLPPLWLWPGLSPITTAVGEP